MRTRKSTVWHWDVSRQARLVFFLARAVIKPLFTIWPMTDRGIELLDYIDELVDRLPRPRGVEIETITLGGVPCERITHPHQATGSLDGSTILYFHGGGFVFCGLATHRALCGLLAARTGAPVVSVEYRQLPESAIGASLIDAMTAYTEILRECDDRTKVIVAGDSAGGYLAMKVAEIAALRGITRPAAVIGYSPLLNLDLEVHDPHFMERDAYLPMSQVVKLKDRWLAGPHEIPGAQSPVNADPALFPPVFLTAAEYEIMRPDVEILTERFEDAGRHIETHLWSGQVHAFPVIGEVLRESRTIIGLTVEFADRALAGAKRHSA
ncbi:MAG: alpha/beta hydrolase [Rhodococcus sp. (in: high G+C Gram-positive bacteria)]|uniref:alpha/beta hydrolase n=1 Tax=Rhodococcus sp. TaxID=1831 RepID=UPI003BAE17E2